MIVGIGCDVVCVRRICALWKAYGPTMLRRIFVGEEVVRARGLSEKRLPGFLAARFAAKEACMKALGTGLVRGMTWHDVETRTRATGAPYIVFSGKTRALFDNTATHVHVSLTHEHDTAMAYVVLEKRCRVVK